MSLAAKSSTLLSRKFSGYNVVRYVRMEVKFSVKVDTKVYKQALKKAKRLDISLNDYLLAALRRMVRAQAITLRV